MARKLFPCHVHGTTSKGERVVFQTFIDPSVVTLIRDASDEEVAQGISCVICLAGNFFSLREGTAEVLEAMEQTSRGLGIDPEQL